MQTWRMLKLPGALYVLLLAAIVIDLVSVASCKIMLDAKLASTSDHPSVVCIKSNTGDVYIGFIVNYHYVIAGKKLEAFKDSPSNLTIYLGAPSNPSTVVWKAMKVMSSEVAVLKTMAIHANTAYMNFDLSLFYNFSKDVDAKIILFNATNHFLYVNVTALTDANCQNQMNQLPPGSYKTTYEDAKHICTLYNFDDICDWTHNIAQNTDNDIALAVNGQPVGLFLEGYCNTRRRPMEWATAIIFSELLYSRDYIMKTAFLV